MKTITNKNTIKLSLILATSLLLSCQDKSQSVKPEMKPLLEAVYASGFVVSKNEYEIFAQAEGYVAEKLVEDGDVVKKGDPIYILEGNQQSARSRMAKETYDLARKNYETNSPVLSELTAALETSHAKLKYDSANFVRYTNLIKSNATSQGEFDRIRLLYENSKNDYTFQRSRYQKTKNQLQLDLINAKNQLAITSDESGRYTLRSEVDGVVFMTSKEKGELIRRNETVAVIGKKDAFYVQLNIDELDVQKIKVGQKVIVKIDAYPSQTFKATINKVFPMVDRRLQSVRADASLEQQLPGAFSGLAVEANIIIRQKDQAMVIPKSKLLPGDSVLIETENGDQKIKVTRGIETLDEVEIIEGLDTGNLLVTNQ